MLKTSKFMTSLENIRTNTLIAVDMMLKIADEKARVNTMINKRPLTDNDIDSMKRVIESMLVSATHVKCMLNEIVSGEYETCYRTLMHERTVLMDAIHEADSRHIQPNANVMHYDEENLIYEFTIYTLDRDVQNDISTGPRMDQIIDPVQYSNIALVKRFCVEDRLYEEVLTKTINSIIAICDHLRDIVDSCKSSLDFLDSPQACCLYEEAPLSASCYESVAIRGNMATSLLKRSFNVLSNVIHNFEIYEKAVSSYTSVVLESAFGEQYKFEVM